MRRLLIIGCGDVALRAIPALTQHYQVFALVRNTGQHSHLHTLGVIPIWGDLDNRRSLARIAGIADGVLHFAPPPNYGMSDSRTRNLLGALSLGQLPRSLVYISTSGVYGDCGGAWVSETHPSNPTTPRAQRRLNAEMQIRNWARRNHVSASILRVPGIYASTRLPLSRILQSSPCIIGSEDCYTNHIHADDLARISIAALRRGAPCRVYHACDDSRLKMGEYFDRVADVFDLPRVPRVSRTEAQRIIPESLLSFMNESRRLTNRRIKCELKISLQYPTVADLLATIKPS